MKYLITSILVIFTITLFAIPGAFAIFPDPEKDPRHYLVRYYTEPDYQAWFDKNFPNDTIEDKVGYSKKIVTADYYVDELFGFAMKYPSVYYEIEDKARTVVEDQSGVIIFRWAGTDEEASGYILHYNQYKIEDIYFDDLLSFYSETCVLSSGTDEEGMSVTTKQTKESWDNDGTRDIVIHECSQSMYFNDNYWDVDQHDTIRKTKNMNVYFLYPNAEQYQLLFSSPIETYSKDVKEFDKIVDSFYVGETEKLSDLLADYAPEVKSATAESSGGCGPGTVLVNGVCELKQEVKSEPIQTSEGCGPGTTMVNGVCELKEASKSTSMSIEPLYIIIAVVAIGGVIGAIAVAKRGSKSVEPKEESKEQPKEESKEQPKEESKEQPKEEPKKELSRFCVNCGNQFKPTAKFCGGCGAPRS